MKNNLKSRKHHLRAFTLIETIIAITLVTVVITAVTGLILSTLLANQRNLHSLQALYLAQENLEAVRFMRDSNWLQNYAWNGGANLWGSDFDSGGTPFYLKEEACSPPSSACFSLSNDEKEGVFTTENGFKFTRSVTFTPVEDEEALEVTALVTWIDKGVPRSVNLSTYLTNWK